MQQVPSQVQDRALVRPAPGAAMAAAVAPTTKEIPYDYVAKFTLEGRSGNRVQDVINISTDGAFVAVAIGYSFIPARPQALTDGQAAEARNQFNTYVGTQIVSVTKKGRPAKEKKGVLDAVGSAFNIADALAPDLRALIHCLLAKLCGISFKYSIVDSGSGRELQNQPIHNIAGLGEPTGNRPFRPLAKPMLYMPRSTIRIEVEEVSEGPMYDGGELFMVLHGYKILGYGTGLP